jgi:uncharacterized protein
VTQAQLAARSGVAQSNIAAYETGKKPISDKLAASLIEIIQRRRPSVVLSEKREAVLEVAKRYKIANVRVFGSIARGTDGPDSDIDLLITPSPEFDMFDLVDLISDLEDLLERHVDVVSEGGLKARHHEIREEAIAL